MRVMIGRFSLLHGLFAIMAIYAAYGCAPRTTPPVSTIAAIRTAGTQEHAMPAFTASASVQSLPNYEVARRACARGQYRQAAEILARMQKSPTLDAEQKEFCHKQELICLSHLAPHKPVSNSASHAGGASETGKAAHPEGTRKPPPYGVDCGPRALLLACQKLGVKATLAELTRAAGTDAHGTQMAGLKRAAEQLKLKAEGVQASREALRDLPVPAIAWSHGNHFLTVLAWNGRGEFGTALVHDPNEAAPRTVSQEKLLQASSGYLLTLRR
jgi:hypothetical protein